MTKPGSKEPGFCVYPAGKAPCAALPSNPYRSPHGLRARRPACAKASSWRRTPSSSGYGASYRRAWRWNSDQADSHRDLDARMSQKMAPLTGAGPASNAH
jgi:hypothetical protein